MSLVRHVSIDRHVVVRTRQDSGRKNETCSCLLAPCVCLRCGYLSLWGISNLTLACLPCAAATCSEITSCACPPELQSYPILCIDISHFPD